jgi:hypothetical protein
MADIEDSGRFDYHLQELPRSLVDSIVMGRLIGDGDIMIELDADCEGCERHRLPTEERPKR